MVHVLIRHKVEDYSRWKSAFDDAIMRRRSAGETSARVFRNYDNANEVSVLCEFETLDRARKYLYSEELGKAMQAAGVSSAPEVLFLNEARTIRRTEAD